jgi:hypothetical protein
MNLSKLGFLLCLLVVCGCKGDGAAGRCGAGAVRQGHHCVAEEYPNEPTVDDTACGAYPILFRLTVAADSAAVFSAYPGGSWCSGGTGTSPETWIRVREADTGEDVPLLNALIGESSNYCPPALCSDCGSAGDPSSICSALCMERTIDANGARYEFDGEYLVADSCSDGRACSNIECAPAGDYIATLCASSGTPSANASTTFSSTPTCFDAPFTWPPTHEGQVIEHVLGLDADAGTDAAASR